MTNATAFGRHAAAYAAARPGYPDDLFDWIAAQAPARSAVLDVGTGNGQAAAALARRFDQVYATDFAGEQIAHAVAAPNVQCTVAPAEASGLGDRAVDAVTVATALHWFDFPRFWPEVARVCRPGGFFCAWTYHRIEADAEITRMLLEPILKVLDPYWSDGNRLSWRGYPRDEIGIPFPAVAAPSLGCRLDWTAAQIAAFVKSWSAHARARDGGKGEELAAIEAGALAKLGEDARRVFLPLTTIAARVS